MSIFILIGGIAFLLLLITWLKLNAFTSLIITSLSVGILMGMPLEGLLKSVQAGIGSTLSGLVLILGFGIMLGTMLSESGAAQRITLSLINILGVRRVKLAMVITGFAVGIAMFYNAGFIILIPLVFTVAAKTGLPLTYVGLAVASSLSVTHGYLPPHPGPTAIAAIFKADVGRTLLYGIIVAIPAVIITGLVFPEYRKHIIANPPKGLFEVKTIPEAEMPSFGISVLVALFPVILMALATIMEFTQKPNEPHGAMIHLIQFLGNPTISMLVAVLVALVLLGLMQGKTIKTLMDKASDSVGSVAMMLLIIGAGGAFKQVLIDSGIGNDITVLFQGISISPLILGWLIATVIRIALGSATVAGLTAAGIVQPLVEASGVNPELMVLSIGAGSLMCSHVNDTGFWMFKEYFGLSIADTFRTWTLMETIVGIVGLLGVLALNLVLVP